MPTGREVIVENTGERALSTDINRLQAFAARDEAELRRNLINVVVGTEDLDAGGLYQPVQASTSPMSADVYGGLLVQPQIGSLNLLVTPGLMSCIVPDSNSDISSYEYVNDPGVSLLGALTIAAGATAQRIDVVECQPSVVAIETDSRDIFNPTTGLFTATTVTKACAAQLTYRVREGAPAGGFPGTAQGWLPLMVASIPSTATSCDAMDFWDVRPLVNDRAFGLESTGQYTFSGGAPLISGSLVPDVRGDLYCGQPDGTSPTLVAGTVTANVAGRRIGGLLQRGTPGVDPTQGLYFDSGAAANQSPGLSSAVTTNTAILYFLYLCLPYGLPRWAFYTPASSGARQPRSPKGIPIVSDVACDINGHAGSNVPLPTTLFGASATCDYFNAVCVAAVPRRYNGGTPWTLRGKRVSWSYQAKNGFPFFLNTAVPMNASSNGVVIEFDTSAAGTPLFPQCATSVRFLATWQLFPGSASAIGLHYNKTLVHGAGGTFYTRDTIAQGTVWLPSNYFDLTGISQTDSMWGDFPIANQMIGTPPNPSFFVFLYSGDSTVAIGNTGTGTAVMTLGTGSNTEGGFLGYENP